MDEEYFRLTFKHLSKYQPPKRLVSYAHTHHCNKLIPRQHHLWFLTINRTPASIQQWKHVAGSVHILLRPLVTPVRPHWGQVGHGGHTSRHWISISLQKNCVVHPSSLGRHVTAEAYSTAPQWCHAGRGLNEGREEQAVEDDSAPQRLSANKSACSPKKADFKYRNLHRCHFSRTKDKNNSTSVSPILSDLQGLKYQ